MSATLTWASSGLATKTGTTMANMFADLLAMFSAQSGNADFSWGVASSSVVSTPFYIVLKPKSGAAGRILIVAWTTAPGSNNPTILDQTPPTTSVFITYFPNGNVDTPSNLTAASGTILGNDTDAVKLGGGLNFGTVYTTLIQCFYFDSAEAILIGFHNPAVSTPYMLGAGNILVDAADNVYPGNVSSNASMSQFGTVNPVFPWVSTNLTVQNTGNGRITGNYLGNNKLFFNAWSTSGPWASSIISSTDILTDTVNNRAYFCAVPLLGQTKGEGIKLKLRQIAMGPATTSPFGIYQTSGPVVQARQFNAATVGGAGYPWLTNFKV